MRRSLLMVGTAVLVSVSATFAAAGVANASDDTSVDQHGMSFDINSAQYEEAAQDPEAEKVSALDPYLDPSAKVFDYDAAIASDLVDEQTAKEFAAVYLASDGTVVASADERAEFVRAAQLFDENDRVQRSVSALAACVGRSGTSGIVVYLNSCQTAQLIQLMNTGGGIAGVAAAISAATGVGAAVAGVIAAALIAQGSIYEFCGSWGRGIKVFPTPIVSCWSQ